MIGSRTVTSKKQTKSMKTGTLSEHVDRTLDIPPDVVRVHRVEDIRMPASTQSLAALACAALHRLKGKRR